MQSNDTCLSSFYQVKIHLYSQYWLNYFRLPL